ncbi:hypothetical protein XELAEV_18026053mg [Xenopus laevis]|uniref:Uncharacterized protein n=1 Tax=Xenopus laevis TaxID=8355 RepID=A0A974CT55_XENLA|nr:hypothetical protein XELAEV_18026053mg [Xenopus laevis]
MPGPILSPSSDQEYKSLCSQYLTKCTIHTPQLYSAFLYLPRVLHLPALIFDPLPVLQQFHRGEVGEIH